LINKKDADSESHPRLAFLVYSEIEEAELLPRIRAISNETPRFAVRGLLLYLFAW
jgi:hypothetical protein